MNYETILVKETNKILTVTFNRPETRNTLSSQFVAELNQVLDEAEQNPQCKVIILEGKDGVFCTGMDFQEVSEKGSADVVAANESDSQSHYMDIIRRFSLMPKVVISKLDGQVIAGGVGLVAASDIVISSPRTTLSLSEALWGLLPCCVMPYLVRRIGFQKAYWMTMTTQQVSADEAYRIGLVDELAKNLEDALRKTSLRLIRLHEETLKDMKAYFRKMWIVNEEMEQIAINEISRLTQKPRIMSNIKNFVQHKQFPWETESKH